MLAVWLALRLAVPESPSIALEPSFYIGHWIGLANIQARVVIANPSTSPIQFTLDSALLRFDTGKQVRLNVERIFDCDGMVPTVLVIWVDKNKSTRCTYSMLADSSGIASTVSRLNDFVSTQAKPAQSPTEDLLPIELATALQVAARRNFLWDAGNWKLTIEYSISNTHHSMTYDFSISEEDISKMKGLIDFYRDGYGVFANCRYLTPDGTQPMRLLKIENAR